MKASTPLNNNNTPSKRKPSSRKSQGDQQKFSKDPENTNKKPRQEDEESIQKKPAESHGELLMRRCREESGLMASLNDMFMDSPRRVESEILKEELGSMDEMVEDNYYLSGDEEEAVPSPLPKKKRMRRKKGKRKGTRNKDSVSDDDNADMPLLDATKKKNTKLNICLDSDDEPLSKLRRARVDERGREQGANQSMYKRKSNPTDTELSEDDQYCSKKFSVTGNWYIAAGYLNDIIELLDAFERCSDWSFDTFSNCWREAKFSLVYRGRQTFKELLEFSEEICLLTKRFLQRPHSSKRRVGALYALYGLYYKHPLRCFFSIRMELSEYQETLELVRPFFTNPENPDPAFIFRKMEVDGAFRHCASSTELCFDFHNNERSLVDLEYGKEKLAKSSVVNEAAPIIQLEADQILLRSYQQSKQDLIEETGLPENAVSMIDPNFVQNVIQDLTAYRKQTLDELNIREPALPPEGDDNPEPDRENVEEPTVTVADSLVNPHIVSGKLLDTVNSSRSAEIFRTREDERKLLNESTLHIMSEPASQTPLQKTRYAKAKMVKDKLTLNDLGPKQKFYTDNRPDLRELLRDVPKPLTRKKQKPRSQAIIEALTEPKKHTKPNVQRKTPKMTLDSDDEQADHHSATKTPRIPINPVDDANLLKLAVKMIADDSEIERTIKVNVSEDRWREIVNDEERFEKFKNRIRPLIKLPKNCKEHRILDIRAVPKSPNKSSIIVINSTYMKEKRELISPELSEISSVDDKADRDFEVDYSVEETCEEESIHSKENLVAELEGSPASASSDQIMEGYWAWKHDGRRGRRGKYKSRSTARFKVEHFTQDNPLTDPVSSSKVAMTSIKVGGSTTLVPLNSKESEETTEDTSPILPPIRISSTPVRTRTAPTCRPEKPAKELTQKEAIAKFSRKRDRLIREMNNRKPRNKKKRPVPAQVPSSVVQLRQEWEDMDGDDFVTPEEPPPQEDYNSIINECDNNVLDCSDTQITNLIEAIQSGGLPNEVLNGIEYEPLHLPDGREILVPKNMIENEVPLQTFHTNALPEVNEPTSYLETFDPTFESAFDHSLANEAPTSPLTANVNDSKEFIKNPPLTNEVPSSLLEASFNDSIESTANLPSTDEAPNRNDSIESTETPSIETPKRRGRPPKKTPPRRQSFRKKSDTSSVSPQKHVVTDDFQTPNQVDLDISLEPPLLATPAVLRDDDAKPRCSFLFSSKIRGLAKPKFSKNEALGKPPASASPRVSFFKKGFLFASPKSS